MLHLNPATTEAEFRLAGDRCCDLVCNAIVHRNVDEGELCTLLREQLGGRVSNSPQRRRSNNDADPVLQQHERAPHYSFINLRIYL